MGVLTKTWRVLPLPVAVNPLLFSKETPVGIVHSTLKTFFSPAWQVAEVDVRHFRFFDPKSKSSIIKMILQRVFHYIIPGGNCGPPRPLEG